MKQVVAGTDNVYAFVKKYKIKTAWGTDILFSQALAERQGKSLADMTRWFTPAEALIMATSTNGELLTLTGLRNPYPGKIGVVEEGALADLLLVDGNPLDNIALVADPARNFVVIMKGRDNLQRTRWAIRACSHNARKSSKVDRNAHRALLPLRPAKWSSSRRWRQDTPMELRTPSGRSRMASLILVSLLVGSVPLGRTGKSARSLRRRIF